MCRGLEDTSNEDAASAPQGDTRTQIRLVNFLELPGDISDDFESHDIYEVPEVSLAGTLTVNSIDASSNEDEPDLVGTYVLTTAQVWTLNQTISNEVPYIAPEDSERTLMTNTPGMEFRGTSFVESLNFDQPQRIPTIFDPTRAGRFFSLDDAYILMMRNLTLHLPNGTYSTLAQSGLLDYFEFGREARLCFADSILVMRSCEGFPSAVHNVICCTARSCIDYTTVGINENGFNITGRLAPLSCYATEESTAQFLADAALAASSSSNTRNRITIALVASACALLSVLLVTLAVQFRARSKQKALRAKQQQEMEEQMNTYQQELEKEKQQSSMEKAELQKMRVQYKMLAMDLLANESDRSGTAASAEHHAREARPAGDAVPRSLTVIDGGAAQSSKSIQHQLRSVLHAADEHTPVSVQAEIGRGAFGVVYRGMWKNIQVAIKTVLFQASGDIKNDPVLREAMLALRIAHINLVATYRANVRMLEEQVGPGEELKAAPRGGGGGGLKGMLPSYQLFLLQEYCDSGTLYDWLSRERMHPGNVPDKGVIVRCALDIARGVQHLHHSEIIHGDLKPQNIMLTTVPESMRTSSETSSPASFPYAAKLTDFGLSFQMDRNKTHMSNMRIGTPFYYAPEVQGKGYLSKAADMYSFGVMLWEMFHGMPPYAADEGKLINNTSFPRFDLRHREDAPFSFVCLALACLSDEHEKRPDIDDVVAVLEDLNEALNGSPNATQLMRNASLKRITKGSYKAGFAAPASLIKQVSSALPVANRVGSASGPKGGKKGKKGEKGAARKEANVAEIILRILTHSGLQRDAALGKRLGVTDAAELERLAGVTGVGDRDRAGGRCVREERGGGGVSSVHASQPWMFDALPPASLADGATAPAGVKAATDAPSDQHLS